MGARGPKAKPTALKIVQGTYRADRAAANEPVPQSGVPSCPTWLAPDGKREWKRLADELAALGLLSEVDRTALALYCQAFAEYREAARIVKAKGLTTVSDKGNVLQHPAVSIRNDAWRRVMKAAADFGMTPASRSRISVPERDDELKADPWAALKQA